MALSNTLSKLNQPYILAPIYGACVNIKGGRTLLAPAPWAFAIWGPIYLSELLLMLYITTTSNLPPTLTTAAPYWFLANVSQALWCLSFRRKYVLSHNPLSYLSSPIYLSLTSLSLLKVHAILTSGPSPWYLILPISLHAGWVSAASLVGLNGSLSYSSSPPPLLALAGYSSVAAALLLAKTVAGGGGGG
ncbi:hypothetical protein TrRE_jg3249, partial [Triparma retinervis]